MISKTKRPEAERAAEWVLRERYNCVVTRRALRTKFAKVDFFAADVIGIRADGTKVFAQATAGSNECVRTRRRKLEAIPWHPSDTVILLQLVETPDPVNQRKTSWFFRVHRLAVTPNIRGEHEYNAGWLDVTEAIPVQKEWFKAWKEKK
jgi:hypothetical protein